MSRGPLKRSACALSRGALLLQASASGFWQAPPWDVHLAHGYFARKHCIICVWQRALWHLLPCPVVCRREGSVTSASGSNGSYGLCLAYCVLVPGHVRLSRRPSGSSFQIAKVTHLLQQSQGRRALSEPLRDVFKQRHTASLDSVMNFPCLENGITLKCSACRVAEYTMLPALMLKIKDLPCL